MTQTATELARIEALIVTMLRELDEQGVIDLDGVQPDGDTELFGQGGLLDSVGLVSLVVAVEEGLADELDIHVGLADERAMSQRHSPYRTVSSLAAYAAGPATD
jgi:acyl carrier protein